MEHTIPVTNQLHEEALITEVMEALISIYTNTPSNHTLDIFLLQKVMCIKSKHKNKTAFCVQHCSYTFENGDILFDFGIISGEN